MTLDFVGCVASMRRSTILDQITVETVVSLVVLQNNFRNLRKPEKKIYLENFWKPFRTFHTLETVELFIFFFPGESS
jgi:hypothetical protein